MYRNVPTDWFICPGISPNKKVVQGSEFATLLSKTGKEFIVLEIHVEGKKEGRNRKTPKGRRGEEGTIENS